MISSFHNTTLADVNNPNPCVPLYVDGSILTGLHDGSFNLWVKEFLLLL